MLSYAGIKSYLTWIGTRHLPYTYEDLPLPAADNHMIDTYIANGNYILLDATTGPHPFKLPSYMIQGKEALVDLGKDTFEIVKVPVIPAEQNVRIDSLRIHIEQNKIIGNCISYYKGYFRFDMYNDLIDKDKLEQIKFLKNFFELGSNKFLIDRFSVFNLDDRDKNLILSIDFNVGDYAKTIGDETYVNLHLDKVQLGEPLKLDRKIPVQYDYQKKSIYHTYLVIPNGYRVTYLPKDTAFTDSLFEYKVSYELSGNYIHITQQAATCFLLLQPEKFAAWNTMLEIIKNTNNATVILKKIYPIIQNKVTMEKHKFLLSLLFLLSFLSCISAQEPVYTRE